MPSHKLACPEGVLHARISDVHHVLTIEMIRKLFCRSGDGYVICVFEQVVNGMYGVEAYIEFRSRWRAARARDALDGHAIYDGCCILAVDLAPPIYTTITIPDDDELAPMYFYDDTPYAEWAAALATAERHDEAPAPSDELQIVSEIDVTAATPIPVVVAASAVAVLPPNAATPFVREDDLHLEVSTGAIGAPLSTALRETDPVVETHTTCLTVCLGSDSSATMTPSSPMASSVSTPASPLTVSAASMGPAVGDLLEGGNDLTSRSPSVCLMLWPPWPPPWYVSFQDVIKCKNTIHGFILESLQLMLWATKNPWPPPFPNRNTVECIKGRIEIRLCCFTSQGAELFLFCYEACGISNLHSTLYIKQISGDWYLRRTMEFESDATLNLILFMLGVQCEQLQPTMFQRSALSCYDTQYLIASTNVDMMLDLLLVRRAICTLWTCRYIDNLQCSSGSTTLAILRINPHCSLLMQCSFIHSQLQSAFWFYTPGHILFSCWACSDFGGSGHVTSKSKPPDIKLQVWLSCFIGHIIQCCFELLQRKIAWPFNLEGHKCVCCLLGTYDQEGLHYCIGTVGVQLHFGCPVEAACLPFPEGYLHGMVQVISSLVHNYMGKILVVLSIAHNAMDMIIGWESRSMACITWIKENVPTQLLEHYLCPTRPHASISVSRLIDDNFSYVLVLVQELDSMLFFFSLECITIQPTKDALHLQQAKNTFDFLQPAGPPTTCDTCSLLMAHGWLDVLTCGVLLVQSYSRLVQVITCPRKQHSCRNFGIPSVDDTILNKYTPCSNWWLLNVSLLQASIGSSFIGYSNMSGCELLHWKISWPLDLVCSASGNKSGPLLHPTIVSPEGYLDENNATLPPFSTITIQVFLLVISSRSHHTGIGGRHYLTSGTASTVPFQFLAYVAIWSFRSLEFCQRKLSWDPGIWALLCFFGLFTQVEATGRRNVAAPAYYRIHCLDHAYFFAQVHAGQDLYLDGYLDQVHIGHDYYIGVFLEQVGAECYFNLVKVCLDYGSHRDLSDVLTHQVPWDPGGSTRHRLEVKPKFKEGRMLATSPTLGWAWAATTGPGLLGRHGGSDYKYWRKGYEQAGLERDGFGLLCFCLLSSSSVPLPVMARTL